MSLCSNSAVLSCLANDVGYEEVFSEQLAVSAQPGDVLLSFRVAATQEMSFALSKWQKNFQ